MVILPTRKLLWLLLCWQIFSLTVSCQIQELVAQTGHTEDVKAVAFSSDGHTLASTGGSSTQEPVAVLQSDNTSPAYAIAISSLTSVAASGGENGTISLWDLQNNRETARLHHHTGPLTGLAFCERRNLLISVGTDGVAAIWDLLEKKLVLSRQFEAVFSSIAIAPDCSLVFLGNTHGASALWHISGVDSNRIDSIPLQVERVAFSPSGRETVMTKEGTLTVFSIVDSRIVRSLETEAYSVYDLGFADDASQAVWISTPSGIVVWPVNGQSLLPLISNSAFRDLHLHWRQLSVCVDKRQAFGLTDQGEMIRFSLPSGEILSRGKPPTGDSSNDRNVTALAVDEQGKQALVGYGDGQVLSVSFSANGDTSSILGAKAGSIRSFWLLQLGEKAVYSTGSQEIGEVDLKTGASSRTADNLRSVERTVVDLGSTEVTKDESGTVFLRETTGGSTTKRFPLTMMAANEDSTQVTESYLCAHARIPSIVGHFNSAEHELYLACGINLFLFRQRGDSDYKGERLAALETKLARYGNASDHHYYSEISALAASDDGRYLVIGKSRWGTFSKGEYVDDVVSVETEGYSVIAHWESNKEDGDVSKIVFEGNSYRYLTVLDSNVGADIPNVRRWGNVLVANDSTARQVATFVGDVRVISTAGFVGLDIVATGATDGRVKVWKMSTNSEMCTLHVHTGKITSIIAGSRPQSFVTAGLDGLIVVWNWSSCVELVRLAVDGTGGWTAAAPVGWFDTSNIENPHQLSWVFADDPFRALAPEILMRDYYEPRLLPRVLNNDPSLRPPARSLEKLNRTQPEILELGVAPDSDNEEMVTVRVFVKSTTSSVQKDAKGHFLQSGVYDLRLFRDGQLVGWAPRDSVEWQNESGRTNTGGNEVDLCAWRKANEIKTVSPELERIEVDGTMVVRFDHVRLPRRAGGKEIVFTSYAFNEDRVKSATATKTVAIPAELVPRQGKAYVISVGVNRTQSSPAWDLQYAANDARRMSDVVKQKLDGTKQFSEVAAVRLVSDEGPQMANELPAREAYLKAVLDLLAGRKVEAKLKDEILKVAHLEKAEPEDLVLLAVSSHGYTDDQGVFHFVLQDVDQPQQVTDTLNRETLNTNQLSAWLRDVDGGEMVMVVDACESEATIQAEGFKPGPMGSRGLGQLAYDKGMRVLAASKAKESAIERGGDIRDGLLSYALAEEGLNKALADWQPKDGKITMGEWLAYGEKRVPELFAEGDAKGTIQIKGAPEGTRDAYHGTKQTPDRYQHPVLFDFNKNQQQTVLTSQ